MTTLITEVYDALLDAGASEPKARKAAEAIAAYEARFAGIELKLEQIGSRVNLLTWMVGALATVLLVVGAPSVWMLIRIAAKVGALG